MNFDNKEILLNSASEGRLVLFLGAGVNAGCKMGVPPKEAPLGEKLAMDLSLEFFPEETPKGNLKSISQKITTLKGENSLRDSLFKMLHPVIPSAAIKHITQIFWAAIYTVNIDSSLETIYENSDEKTQQLVPVILPDDISPQDSLSQVGYYKLHGCLLKPESKLIFSHRDYSRSREKNLKLFSKLTVALCDCPFLFIGFSFEDSDIQDVLENVLEYTGKSRRHYPTFVLVRSPQPSDIESMKTEGVNVIPGSTEEFLPWLKANLRTKPLSIKERIKEIAAPVSKWAKEQFNKDIDPYLAKKLKECCTIVSEIPPAYNEPDQSRFFYGVSPSWEDISLGIPIPRELGNTIRNDLEAWIEKGKHNINIILGAAGYGKTTLMMQLAFEFAKREDVVILWQKQSVLFDPIAIIEFCKEIAVPVIIFIDNASKFMQSIRTLSLDAETLKLPLYIVAGSRGYEWNDVRGTNAIETENPWHLPRLTIDEARLLAKSLKKTKYLANPYNEATEEALTNHFYEESNKHLLAGLKVAITGSESKFDEIIADEFYQIKDELVRNLYKRISLIQSIGLGTPLTLACYFTNVSLQDFHIRFESIIDEIILEEKDEDLNNLFLFSQHRVIAESIINNVVQPTDLVELILDVAKSIDYHDSSQNIILKRLYHQEYLTHVLKETGRIRSTYTELISEFPSEPYIRQHAAIFESHVGEFVKARELIEEAIELKGRHPHLLNTKGNIWLRDALHETDPERAEYALKQGVVLIRERIKKDSDKEIHYHSLIDKLIRWAGKSHLSEKQRIRVLEEAQDDLDKALTYYPTSSDLVALAGRLSIELENIPGAENNLIRSIKLDSGNIWARVLLARLLLNKKDSNGALKIVNEGLLYNSNVCSLLRLRITCLEKLGADWDQMKSALVDYLKIATKDYRQRLLLIRGLILNRRFSDAAKHITIVRETYYLPFDVKLNNVVELGSQENPFVADGIFTQRRMYNGFMKIDGFPGQLDAFLDFRRVRGNTDIQNGQRVKAEIALNGFGLFVKQVI